MSRARLAQGFSLIELLVVILIMGILMTLAYPRLFGQRTIANDSTAKAALLQGLSVGANWAYNHEPQDARLSGDSSGIGAPASTRAARNLRSPTTLATYPDQGGWDRFGSDPDDPFHLNTGDPALGANPTPPSPTDARDPRYDPVAEDPTNPSDDGLIDLAELDTKQWIRPTAAMPTQKPSGQANAYSIWVEPVWERGDRNGDGRVTFADLDVLPLGPSPTYTPQPDGTVDTTEYNYAWSKGNWRVTEYAVFCTIGRSTVFCALQPADGQATGKQIPNPTDPANPYTGISSTTKTLAEVRDALVLYRLSLSRVEELGPADPLAVVAQAKADAALSGFTKW